MSVKLRGIPVLMTCSPKYSWILTPRPLNSKQGRPRSHFPAAPAQDLCGRQSPFRPHACSCCSLLSSAPLRLCGISSLFTFRHGDGCADNAWDGKVVVKHLACCNCAHLNSGRDPSGCLWCGQPLPHHLARAAVWHAHLPGDHSTRCAQYRCAGHRPTAARARPADRGVACADPARPQRAGRSRRHGTPGWRCHLPAGRGWNVQAGRRPPRDRCLTPVRVAARSS